LLDKNETDDAALEENIRRNLTAGSSVRRARAKSPSRRAATTKADLVALMQDHESALRDLVQPEVDQAAAAWRAHGFSVEAMKRWVDAGLPFWWAKLAADFEAVGITVDIAFRQNRANVDGRTTLYSMVASRTWTVDQARAALDDWHRRQEMGTAS
jgi:hypothetical protein